MKKYVQILLKYFMAVRYFPLIMLFYFFNKKRDLVSERNVWYDVIYPDKKKNFSLFVDLLNLAEYRSVLYFRLGGWSSFVKWLARGQYALHLSGSNRVDVGCGLVIQHGHSTRVGAKSIGHNCQIWQNVTIGTNKPHSGNFPVIGNNVKICAGAIVIGDIKIGDNVTIGAGCVVVKDIPSNCVVVGNPARIVKYL